MAVLVLGSVADGCLVGVANRVVGGACARRPRGHVDFEVSLGFSALGLIPLKHVYALYGLFLLLDICVVCGFGGVLEFGEVELAAVQFLLEQVVDRDVLVVLVVFDHLADRFPQDFHYVTSHLGQRHIYKGQKRGHLLLEIRVVSSPFF